MSSGGGDDTNVIQHVYPSASAVIADTDFFDDHDSDSDSVTSETDTISDYENDDNDIRRLTSCLDAAQKHQLTETSPQAPQPAHVCVQLRPHQKTLLAAARRIESYAASGNTINTRYGVLADRVGAGKSLVVLSLVRDPPVKQTRLIFDENGGACVLRYKQCPPVQDWDPEWDSLNVHDMFTHLMGADTYPSCSNHNPNCDSCTCKKFYTRSSLLIVPHNTITQWETYVRTQTTGLKPLFVRRASDISPSTASWFKTVFTSELIIVSNTMLKKFKTAFSDYFHRIVWSRLFLDEADTIVCPLMRSEVFARFMWFITGSWLNMVFPDGVSSWIVETHFKSYRSLCNGPISGIRANNFVRKMLYGRYNTTAFTQLILRNSDAWIEASIARPPIYHRTILCKSSANLSVLNGFITESAMEALHAGDISGALTALGLKATAKNSLVDCVTEQIVTDIKAAEKILAFKREMEYSTPAIKAVAIEKAEAKVARLKDQLASLQSRIQAVFTSGSTELCPICVDTIRTPCITPCCHHAFCLPCLCECIVSNPVCPLCRAPLKSVKDLLVVDETHSSPAEQSPSEQTQQTLTEQTEQSEPLQTKSATLVKLLTDLTANPENRCLVFSAYEASFKRIRDVGIHCELLQGTAAHVDKLRKQFQDGKLRVLCMNSRHVGAGINLESATHIILYHRMSADMEQQMIGRAIRFERTKAVHVIHLAHEGEVLGSATPPHGSS